MNRPIKFRAWDKREKQMMSCRDWSWFSDVYMPEAETDYHALMQFTGLLDKNGKEIYEGDIVRTVTGDGKEKQPPAEVYFTNAMFFRGSTALFWNEAYTGFLEVIGNIYENPELLPTNP